MKINKNIIAIVLLISIFGTMTITKAAGVWSDKDGLTKAVEEAKKELSKETINTIDSSGEETQKTANKLDISVSEIKGSSTFQQVSEVYGVELGNLIEAFSLDSNINGGTKIKDLATIFGNEDDKNGSIGTSSVRYFVALYIGEEFVNNEEYLPKAAVELLNRLNKLNDNAKLYLNTHTVNK